MVITKGRNSFAKVSNRVISGELLHVINLHRQQQLQIVNISRHWTKKISPPERTKNTNETQNGKLANSKMSTRTNISHF